MNRNPSREWMYQRRRNGPGLLEFANKLETFIDFASSHPEFLDGEKMKCPCAKCKNRPYRDPFEVRMHICQRGFVPNYYVWTYHGEMSIDADLEYTYEPNTYHTMVMDAAGPEFNYNEMDGVEEAPNPEAQRFYDMLTAADNELWPGCENHTQLSLVARLMALKSEHHISERCFDQFTSLLKEVVPKNNMVTSNFYSTKKLLRGMGLPVEKIDCCADNCMLYWKDDIDLVRCKHCNKDRYHNVRRPNQNRQVKKVAQKRMYYFPLTPRLKRLYASKATAEEMRWHATSIDDGVMRHPADSPAWKHLDMIFPSFAAESRNVRLGLSTDGFQPFGQTGKQYSSWPVIVTPYNLPPWLCMKEQHMFLTVLVPGPRNPKEKIDVFLQPLIEELIQLWDKGVPTYDISLKQNFQMRAALIWTISDFPAYSMLSGWSTAGRLACPHCMDDTDAFTLASSGKQSWFDNHRKFLSGDHPFRKNKTAFMKNKSCWKEPPQTKSGEDILREIEGLGLKKVTELNDNVAICKAKGCGWKRKSIFWDLPYWSSLLIRHNLDVMHIEKNVFDNIFNTVLNVKGKTKDTPKSREELNKYCSRPALKLDQTTGKYPKACYTLDKKEMNVLFEWVKELKFPDGYVSNMSRCVDMNKLKMFGVKSHDCHVFMQRILPIAFRELLPSNVWKAITELSFFFKDLCSRNIKLDDMCRLHENIPIILCKLERIFPPSFFDSMEHLPVHLADEARIAGPVQYRWMYPFERYLRKLKNNVRNKARVEGSISNAYLVEEASSFCSYYFEDHIMTRHRSVPRNYDGGRGNSNTLGENLSIFQLPGRAFGKMSKRWLTDVEYKAVRIYILLNCSEVTDQYVPLFVEGLTARTPNISTSNIDKEIDKEFPNWFANYAQDHSHNVNQLLVDLSVGPSRMIHTCHGYFVNGYKFHTVAHGSQRATINSGVCVKGTNYTTDESDYYGRLLEVVEVEYPGLPIKKTTMFKCEWFDTSPRGTMVHPDYKMISVHQRRRYAGEDAFVLATQAIQVFYCSYPSLNQSKSDWLAVCKINARSNIDVPSNDAPTSSISPPFQDDEHVEARSPVIDVDDDPLPIHPDGGLIDIEETNIDDSDTDDEEINLSDEESSDEEIDDDDI